MGAAESVATFVRTQGSSRMEPTNDLGLAILAEVRMRYIVSGYRFDVVG